jgi:hypothetical protein
MICRSEPMRADLAHYVEQHRAGSLHWSPMRLWRWMIEEYGDEAPKAHNTVRDHVRRCLNYDYQGGAKADGEEEA